MGVIFRPMTLGDLLRIILAFFLPPLAVASQVGLTGAFWLNLLFWLLSFGGLGLPLLAVMWAAQRTEDASQLVVERVAVRVQHWKQARLQVVDVDSVAETRVALLSIVFALSSP